MRYITYLLEALILAAVAILALDVWLVHANPPHGHANASVMFLSTFLLFTCLGGVSFLSSLSILATLFRRAPDFSPLEREVGSWIAALGLLPLPLFAAYFFLGG